jgi:hypothetical protein
VYLSLDPKAWQPWNAEPMRDTTDIGHFGMGIASTPCARQTSSMSFAS